MTDMLTKDALGDRMKAYEGTETAATFDKDTPTYARLDGRSFSNLTRGLVKPFDAPFAAAIADTAKFLLEETGARYAFTQSDEISLVYDHPNVETQQFFGGRKQKLITTLASLASVKFYKLLEEYDIFDAKKRKELTPTFDCRACNLPDVHEATNMVFWRWLDCHRNAIQGLGQRHFSQKQLNGISMRDLLPKLASIGVDFYAMPEQYRNGTSLTKEGMTHPNMREIAHDGRLKLIFDIVSEQVEAAE